MKNIQNEVAFWILSDWNKVNYKTESRDREKGQGKSHSILIYVDFPEHHKFPETVLLINVKMKSERCQRDWGKWQLEKVKQFVTFSRGPTGL